VGALTSVLTGPQEVDDVGVMPQFTQNFQFSGKVPMVIFRGILCKESNVILARNNSEENGLLRSGVNCWWEVGRPGVSGTKKRVRLGSGVTPRDLSAF
jgi:hypothetical protein